MVLAKLVTATKGTCSAAPSAVFLATGVNDADLSLGTITASAPAAHAERIAAPKFLGSVTPSRIKNSCFSSSSFSNNSSKKRSSLGGVAITSSTMP